ncbi:MAG: imidazole glycerol phosphate synthase subunit HisH [Clostridia bacterium]|nr:imidazole glycerol phosphate synthase subunit HisH [Clostridia bacterium]
MIAIVDYGVGNLFSLTSSFKAIGIEAVATGDEKIIKNAEKIILPGVGAFSDAAAKLRQSGLDELVCERAKAGVPMLGICLGMQLLFEKSYEYGEHEGLGLIPGAVIPMKGKIADDLKIPHIGWNPLSFPKNREKSVLYRDLNEGDCVYFVHSYYASGCDEYVTATAEYGIPITASVERGNVYGAQFHPEKSGKTGLSILKAFADIK